MPYYDTTIVPALISEVPESPPEKQHFLFLRLSSQKNHIRGLLAPIPDKFHRKDVMDDISHILQPTMYTFSLLLHTILSHIFQILKYINDYLYTPIIARHKDIFRLLKPQLKKYG